MTSAPASTRHWVGPYLAVDGAPFPVIGAEIHNSSSSSTAAISESFATVRQLGANTVLAPVAWDLLEPAEGEFDFTVIDTMIATAQELGLRLIPLWFGSWKNAASTYAPAWVKTDPERFPRSVLSDGAPVENLSPFSTASRDADARAFATLMSRIRDTDTDHTVLAVQIENEIGLLGDTRDRSRFANTAFAAAVPSSVVDAIADDPGMPLHEQWVVKGARRIGSWNELFPPGDRADEAFMAAAFAAYTGAVAAAGAAQHDIPLFVNAWLDADSVLDGPVAVAGGKRPGDYPSGGPVMSVAAIWEALAPALHFLAVDAYVEDAEPVFAAYQSRRERLFVPELRADGPGIVQMFSAIGHHHALGVSPFGVDSLTHDDPEAEALRDAFRLLNAVAHLIRHHPDARTEGFILNTGGASATTTLQDVTVHARASDGDGATPGQPAYGITIDNGDGSLFVIGRGFEVTLTAPAGKKASFLSAIAHDITDASEFIITRHLNGDETGGGTRITFPSLGSAFLSGRVIPTRLPDTGIVQIRPYLY